VFFVVQERETTIKVTTAHADTVSTVIKSASRLCRYKPSLSNRSNRWGQPWQQQAYCVSSPAQMLPTVRDPEIKI